MIDRFQGGLPVIFFCRELFSSVATRLLLPSAAG